MEIVYIDKETLNQANSFYEFNELNGSITNGKSNIYGAIGELVIIKFFKERGYNVNTTSTYDYDLIIDGYKIDVKTKKTSVIPENHYLCSISSFNITQKCDFYFFVRVNENFKEAYLLGYKSKKDFFKEAEFHKKGDLDINGWIFKDDCYNLKISQLIKFKK
jgi:penicillin-binding protein-related factor A (putative recombinase)